MIGKKSQSLFFIEKINFLNCNFSRLFNPKMKIKGKYTIKINVNVMVNLKKP